MSDKNRYRTIPRKEEPTMEESGLALRPETEPELGVAVNSDEKLVAMWLHGRPEHTRRAYAGDVARLFANAGKGLRELTLTDLQAFADSLSDYAPASRARILSTARSLLAFAHRTGYIPFNVGSALRLPRLKNALAERILSETDVQRLIALEKSQRNRALLRLLYAAGLRVSEACGLRWRDAQPRDDAGQVTVYGKGGKTRTVLLSREAWRELVALRGESAGPDAPIFRSNKGGPLTARQVCRIVAAAARAAGIEASVSPHWLRHAHASHALDRGCPPHLVQATLGHASLATTGRYTHARPSDSSARYLSV
ncbi:MAG: tyrosine-type recombinase/integrase [Bacillota bacterium]